MSLKVLSDIRHKLNGKIIKYKTLGDDEYVFTVQFQGGRGAEITCRKGTDGEPLFKFVYLSFRSGKREEVTEYPTPITEDMMYELLAIMADN